jgi:hypothetical protein
VTSEIATQLEDERETSTLLRSRQYERSHFEGGAVPRSQPIPTARRTGPNEGIDPAPSWVVRFLGLCCVGLIPWTIALAVTLPRHYLVADWPLAWAGFDVILFGCLSTTAWALWKQRQVAVPASMITAVLLACDAWFDILTAIGGRCLIVSIVTAMLVEIPLAVLLALISTRLLQASMRVARGLEPNAALHSVWITPLITSADRPQIPARSVRSSVRMRQR